MSARHQKPVRQQADLVPPVSAAEFVGSHFDFGSGHYHSPSVKQRQCIIYRSRTAPALIGLTAENRARLFHLSTG
ncbi:MAG: hypothetical protein DME26_21945 [Verrucomicrobia bacterium]|nr:MAG: hypothetical protein DME26_21945 [Verrucomicrobiota bacterium]